MELTIGQHFYYQLTYQVQAPPFWNLSELNQLMRPLGQADRLVHEEAHPILPQLVEPILESVDCTRVYDALW